MRKPLVPLILIFLFLLRPLSLTSEEKPLPTFPQNNCAKFKVGLQVGHWLKENLPDEFASLKNNGVKINGVEEFEVTLKIALKTKKILEKKGVQVEILPAKIPAGYEADAFLALHADESKNPNLSGFRAAPSFFDVTQKAQKLASLINSYYEKEVKIPFRPIFTSRMTHYYAFNWRDFFNTVSKKTPAALLETGFLTNATDFLILTKKPELPAKSIALALLDFLGCQNNLSQLK
jgi:N-acetylmuramoyl-L-alanine amidase